MSAEVSIHSALTIDGLEVSFEPGMSILQAAAAAGIDIPNLCAHPHLRPFGRCRLCLVEVDGLRGYPSACTTPATAGAVVRTESPELTALRRGALELVLTEHPTGCLLCGHQDDCLEHHGCHSRRSGTVTGCRFCPNDQQCELQDMVERLGITDLDLEVSYRGLPVDRRDPFFDRDYNLCILCARCVRACDERRDAQAVALTFRGPRALVGTAYNRRLLETECQFCGECVDLCPTGALAERVNKWVGVPTAAVTTTCPFCSLGCQLEMRVREGQIIGARPVGDEQLCAKGRFAAVEMALPAGRALRPQIRLDGRLVAVDWDEALAAAAAHLTDAPAIFASRDLLTEDLREIAALAERLGAGVAGDAEPLPELGPVVHGVAELERAELLIGVGLDLRYAQTPVQLAMARAVTGGAALLLVATQPGDLDRRAQAVLRPELGAETALLDALGAVVRGETAIAEPLSAAAREVLTRRPAVLVWDAALAARDDGWTLTASLAALAEALDAKVLPVVEGANWRGAGELGLTAGGAGLPAVTGEPRPLLSFGRPPLAMRPTTGFWVACTHLIDEVTATADVVLPLPVLGEESGTVTDVFGRLREVTAAVAPAGECRPAREVCERLALALAVATAMPPREPVVERVVSRPPSAARRAGRLHLVREYSRFTWRGHALADRVPGVIPLAGENVLRIHPEDAAALELRDGDAVRLGSAEQPVDTSIQVTTRVAPGTARLVVPPECEIGPLGSPLAQALGPNPGQVTISRLLSLTGDA